MHKITLRGFRTGDGPLIAEAWTRAAPGDGFGYRRFRDLVLLDRNFDPDGLIVAINGTMIIGAAYGVRRLIARDRDDLEPGSGWIPFFFVRPQARRQGVGRRLLETVLDWLPDQGAGEVILPAYTPNHVLPGLDADRYPQGRPAVDLAGLRNLLQLRRHGAQSDRLPDAGADQGPDRRSSVRRLVAGRAVRR